MSQAFNPVFAFKNIINEDDARRITSQLVQFPLIWDFLSNEEVFKIARNIFGSDPSNWEAKNLILSIERITPEININSNVDIGPRSKKIYEELKVLSTMISGIIAKRQNDESWDDILDFELTNLGIDEQKFEKMWQQIFSIILLEENNREELEQAVIKKSNEDFGLLAALLVNYDLQNPFLDFLKDNKNYFITNLTRFKQLITNLENLGGRKAAQILVTELLNMSDLFMGYEKFQDYLSDQQDLLSTIEQLNDLRFLSEYVGNNDKKEYFQNLAKNIFEKILNTKPARSYEEKSHLQNDDLFSLDVLISVDKNNLEFFTSENKQILDDLIHAFEIAESDKNSAKQICGRYIKLFDTNQIHAVIYSPKFGYVIDPIDISKLLITIGWEDKAILFLEDILAFQPFKPNLIKILAFYSNLFGDHHRANKYYSKLFASGDISRSEKILFGRTLQYLGLWQDVVSVRETVNTISVNDDLEYAYAVYKAKNGTNRLEIIGKLLSKYPKNGTAKAIHLISGDQEDLLNEVLNDRNSDIRTIQIIGDYYYENGKYDAILSFQNLLPRKNKAHPEIELLICKAFFALGNTEAGSLKLRSLSKSDTIARQEVFEEVIQLLLEHHLIADLVSFLDLYNSKWTLSSRAIYARSFVYLEEKEFCKARDLISYSLKDEKTNSDTLLIFGSSLLKTPLRDLPYHFSVNQVNPEKKELFLDLFDHLPEHKKSLLLEIINIEMLGGDTESKYLELLSRIQNEETSENWRIAFGLGIINFNNKSFDQAIIFLKETLKSIPTHAVIVDLLIQSYNYLKLPAEAIGLIEFQAIRGYLSLNDLIKYSEYLYEYNEFRKFLEINQLDDQNGLIYSLGLVNLYIKIGDFKQASFVLSKIEPMKDIDPRLMTTIAQLFLDCEDRTSAQRILEKFLSMMYEIDETSLFRCASIYYQLGDYKKSANLLRSVKEAVFIKSLAEADILIQENQIEEAVGILGNIFSLNENKEIRENLLHESIVKIPENWTLDLQSIYSLMINLQIRSKNFIKTLKIAKEGLDKFPESDDLRKYVFTISSLSDAIDEKNNLLQDYEQGIIQPNSDLDLIIADIALENKQEILAAKILSESNPQIENKHLSSIQARLLVRNDQKEEAKRFFHLLITENNKDILSKSTFQSTTLYGLLTEFSACKTAYEIGDLPTALEMCKTIHNEYGPVPKNDELFIKTFTQMAEKNSVLESVLVTNNLLRITDEDLNVLNKILDESFSDLVETNENILKVKALVTGKVEHFEKAAKLPLSQDNLFSIVSALLGLGKETDAETILLNPENNNPHAILLFALSIIKTNPAKAAEKIQGILQKSEPLPEYYAGLSMAYEQLGQISESYSAVALALNIWPNEYQWEIMAGELCRKMGNNLAAEGHFRRAQTMNFDLENGQSDGLLRIQSEFAREALTNSARDIPLLIDRINTLLDENLIEEAENHFKNIQKYIIENDAIAVLQAKIEFSKGNILESKMVVKEILLNSPSNFNAIILNAQIIKTQDGGESAILYLEQIIENEKIADISSLIIEKAKYLEESNGVEAAISYLNNEINNAKKYINVLIYCARLYLEYEKFLEAQKIAEEALNIESNNAELLGLLSTISNNLGDLDKAIDFMVRSLTLDPYINQNYIFLSKLFEARRDFRRSMDILKEGIFILPNDHTLLRYTGLLLYKRGNYEEAYATLLKAYVIKKDDYDLKQILSLLENSLKIKSTLDEDRV